MNFIIVPKEAQQFEVEQLFSFYIGNHGDWRHLVGRYQGNIQDKEFRIKLDRVRARMMIKGIPHHQSVSPVTIKEVKKLNNLERYNRKMSRLFNEFWRKVDSLTGLFREEELQKLSLDYKNTVAILKERYNQL